MIEIRDAKGRFIGTINEDGSITIYENGCITIIKKEENGEVKIIKNIK